MTVSISNDMEVPAGFKATDIEKQFAQTSTTPPPPTTTVLSDSEEPGSVIVFPKFIQGAVSTSEGTNLPITELEIGVVCPKTVTCFEHQPVKIRFHWVCGSTEADLNTSFICKETDFDVTATVWEKIVLTPNGETVGAYNILDPTKGLPNHFAPGANCPQGGGYLIGWVISPLNDKPIKFDALIGDAHLRPGTPAQGLITVGSPTALGDYDAIPIQADPALASGALITTNANGALFFDGAAGHYQAVTGQVIGDIRYTNLVTTAPSTTTRGVLTLLTLDVKSNRPNGPTFVDLDFFGGNPSVIGNENQLSTSTEFICWEEVPIDLISPNLTTAVMGRKGVFASAPATDILGNNVTLLGLSEVLEGPNLLAAVATRASFTNLFNSSVPIPTRFVPTPSPNFLP